jgi:hypothetical protein
MATKRTVIERIFDASRIWQAYFGSDFYCSAARDLDTLTHDRVRFLEIVKAANTIAQQKYQSSLVVILWDLNVADSGEDPKWIEAKLLENRIPNVDSLKDSKGKGFREMDCSERWIVQRDGHPDPRAYREVAKTLVSWLQQNPSLLAPSLSKEPLPADQDRGKNLAGKSDREYPSNRQY